MGVVRREGDWRLEKRDEGVYEITYRKHVEVKVLTPDYRPETTEIPAVDVVPVRELDSYPEVEGLFEEHAHGGPPDSVDPPSSETGGSRPDERPAPRDAPAPGKRRGGGLDVGNLPPGGLALALLAVGALVIHSVGVDPGSAAFVLGALFVLGGIAIFGWAAVLYRTRGWAAARGFLTSVADAADEGVPPLRTVR